MNLTSYRELIVNVVCEEFDRSPQNLKGRRGPQRDNWPRAIAISLTRELTQAPLADIGRQFGVTHGSVIHAIQRTVAAETTNPVDKDSLLRIRGIIQDRVKLHHNRQGGSL